MVGDDGAKFDWGTVGARGEVVVLNLNAFDVNVSELPDDASIMDDCSFASLIPEAEPYWNAAGRVLVFHEGKRRLLKADDYEDTGAEGVEPSPIEDVEAPDSPPDEIALAEHKDTGESTYDEQPAPAFD